MRTDEWSYFTLGGQNGLFEVKYGLNLELNALTETTLNDPEGIAFVSRTEKNNGVSAYVKRISGLSPQPAGTLTVAGGGSVLSTHLQDRPFYSGRDLFLLLEKQPMSEACKLFIKTIIEKDKYRFNYGRQANKSLSSMRIKLPADDDGKPNWKWMEEFVKSLHNKRVTTSIATPKMPLDAQSWGTFKLGGKNGLFEIRKGIRLTSENQTEGTTPYIGAIDSNNGVSNLIGQAPCHLGNTISLNYNGSVGEAFYQPEPFWATDDVNVLYLQPEHGKLNVYTALFICAILRREQYRFSYGRKWTLDSMNSTLIKLPKTIEGKPDWAWIESYMKTLPFSDRLGSQ